MTRALQILELVISAALHHTTDEWATFLFVLDNVHWVSMAYRPKGYRLEHL